MKEATTSRTPIDADEQGMEWGTGQVFITRESAGNEHVPRPLFVQFVKVGAEADTYD